MGRIKSQKVLWIQSGVTTPEASVATIRGSGGASVGAEIPVRPEAASDTAAKDVARVEVSDTILTFSGGMGPLRMERVAAASTQSRRRDAPLDGAHQELNPVANLEFLAGVAQMQLDGAL